MAPRTEVFKERYKFRNTIAVELQTFLFYQMIRNEKSYIVALEFLFKANFKYKKIWFENLKLKFMGYM